MAVEGPAPNVEGSIPTVEGPARAVEGPERAPGLGGLGGGVSSPGLPVSDLPGRSRRGFGRVLGGGGFFSSCHSSLDEEV